MRRRLPRQLVPPGQPCLRKDTLMRSTSIRRPRRRGLRRALLPRLLLLQGLNSLPLPGRSAEDRAPTSPRRTRQRRHVGINSPVLMNDVVVGSVGAEDEAQGAHADVEISVKPDVRRPITRWPPSGRQACWACSWRSRRAARPGPRRPVGSRRDHPTEASRRSTPRPSRRCPQVAAVVNGGGLESDQRHHP